MERTSTLLANTARYERMYWCKFICYHSHIHIHLARHWQIYSVVYDIRAINERFSSVCKIGTGSI